MTVWLCMTIPRTKDPTLGYRRIIWGNLSDVVGSDRNGSEIVGILVTGFLSEVVGVGKCRNVVVPMGTRLIRHFPTSDNFRWESSDKDPTISDTFPSDPVGTVRPGDG